MMDFLKETYIYIHFRFVYYTVIYPHFVKHYWCKFYNPITETEEKGWYVLDKNNKMIPWVHSDKFLICLYPSMIKPIQEE